MLSKSEHMQHVNTSNTFRGPCFDVVKNVISPPGLSMSKQVQHVNHGRSHIAHVQANQNPTHKRAKRTPAPPNIPDEHVSCTAAAMRNASLQVLFTCPTPANPFETATQPSRFAHLWQGAESPAPAMQKRQFFTLLISKFVSRHNCVHFTTSKSAPSMVCSVHFDFELCLAPPQRALFRHLNF